MVISTRAYAFLFFILLLANVGLYRPAFMQKEMQIETIPAGKGSVVLIRTADRKIIVVGAGPDASALRALGTALPPWEREIDLLVLRSVATKEAGGAPDILKRYRVQTLARPRIEGSYTWETALAVASADTQIVHIEEGGVLSLGATLLTITTTPGKTPATIVVSDGVTAEEIK